MENNSDRMGFALIALSVIAFVLLAVNGPLKSTVNGFFNGFKEWQTQTVNGINETTKQEVTQTPKPDVTEPSKPDVTHTAYSWSADGTDRFTTTKPNLNLLDRTRQNISVQGNNSVNQRNGMYYFGNGTNLFQQNIGTSTKVTFSFDWIATNPTSGSFNFQYNDTPWLTSLGLDSTKINVTPTNNSGHVVMSFSSSAEENTSTAIATGIELRLDNVPTNTNITISNFKYELSSKATPYMPSASEVKASDQPKYIGTYTDKTETASQEPSKYTWKLNPDYHE